MYVTVEWYRGVKKKPICRRKKYRRQKMNKEGHVVHCTLYSETNNYGPLTGHHWALTWLYALICSFLLPRPISIFMHVLVQVHLRVHHQPTVPPELLQMRQVVLMKHLIKMSSMSLWKTFKKREQLLLHTRQQMNRQWLGLWAAWRENTPWMDSSVVSTIAYIVHVHCCTSGCFIGTDPDIRHYLFIV